MRPAQQTPHCGCQSCPRSAVPPGVGRQGWSLRHWLAAERHRQELPLWGCPAGLPAGGALNRGWSLLHGQAGSSHARQGGSPAVTSTRYGWHQSLHALSFCGILNHPANARMLHGHVPRLYVDAFMRIAVTMAPSTAHPCLTTLTHGSTQFNACLKYGICSPQTGRCWP